MHISATVLCPYATYSLTSLRRKVVTMVTVMPARPLFSFSCLYALLKLSAEHTILNNSSLKTRL